MLLRTQPHVVLSRAQSHFNTQKTNGAAAEHVPWRRSLGVLWGGSDALVGAQAGLGAGAEGMLGHHKVCSVLACQPRPVRLAILVAVLASLEYSNVRSSCSKSVCELREKVVLGPCWFWSGKDIRSDNVVPCYWLNTFSRSQPIVCEGDSLCGTFPIEMLLPDMRGLVCHPVADMGTCSAVLVHHILLLMCAVYHDVR